jgi:hypothetical protein
VSSKHDNVGLHREPDDSSSPAITASAVNGLDEMAKRKCLPFLIGLHQMKISAQAWLEPLGVHPIGNGREFWQAHLAATERNVLRANQVF